jgi:hypothetical protein
MQFTPQRVAVCQHALRQPGFKLDEKLAEG